MSTYTMIDGQVRIYDSTDDLRSLAGGNVEIYDASGPSYTDVTSAARSASGSLTGDFCADSGDYLYVGHTAPFARITFDLDTAAVGAGALTVEYYDGSAWSAISGVTDGTASGGNTFAQDGVVSFKPPADWDKQGTASLDSDKYYVRLSTANVPSTPPNAEQAYPVDGQYFALIFDEGNLSAPEGRARPEETAILHRGRAAKGVHYIGGPDAPILEPVELTFGVRVDTVYNRNALLAALTCGNPNYDTNWDAAGTSTKGDTSLVDGDGNSFTLPGFADSEKKTVCVEILWTKDGVQYGRAYHEVYFPPDQQSLAESEEGVIVSCTGLVYGKIEEIFWFAYQY